MKNNLLISIVLPVYNCFNTIERALKSVLAQTHGNWELIIINDGSTDKSQNVIDRYVRQDSRIKTFFQNNKGVSAARNRGILETKGAFIAFLDADDWLSSDYLAELVEPISDNKVDLVCAGYYEVNKKFPTGLGVHDFPANHLDQTINCQTYQKNLFNGVSGVLWAKLFKREIVVKNKIYLDPEVKLYEDLLFVLQYSLFIQNVFIVSAPGYFYNRLNENSVSSKLKISQYEDLVRTNNILSSYSNQVSFINFNNEIKKRSFVFLIRLLWDNTSSYNEFSVTFKFVKDNYCSRPQVFTISLINRILTKLIALNYILLSYIFVKAIEIIRKIK